VRFKDSYPPFMKDISPSLASVRLPSRSWCCRCLCCWWFWCCSRRELIECFCSKSLEVAPLKARMLPPLAALQSDASYCKDTQWKKTKD